MDAALLPGRNPVSIGYEVYGPQSRPGCFEEGNISFLRRDSIAGPLVAIPTAIALLPVFRKSSEFVGKPKKSKPSSYLTDMRLANRSYDRHVSCHSLGATHPCYFCNRPTRFIWSLEINFI